MSEVAIVVPTLGRAERLAPLVENIAASTPPVYCVLFVVDADDTASQDVALRLALLRDDVAMLEHDGTLAVKTNAGVRATGQPWLLLCGDDVCFYPGWWQATAPARQDPSIGVIGTNDLHNERVLAGEYATQILVRRRYIEMFGGSIAERGRVYHEGYHHDPVDMELCFTAQARGAYCHAHEAKIEHLHPDYGLRDVDDTDRKGQLAAKRADLALFERRRELWET